MARQGGRLCHPGPRRGAGPRARRLLFGRRRPAACSRRARCCAPPAIRLAEWLYEEGIGENRAILVEDGAIVEAAIELPGLRAGAVVRRRRLTSVAGIATLDDGSEAIVRRARPDRRRGLSRRDRARSDPRAGAAQAAQGPRDRRCRCGQGPALQGRGSATRRRSAAQRARSVRGGRLVGAARGGRDRRDRLRRRRAADEPDAGDDPVRRRRRPRRPRRWREAGAAAAARAIRRLGHRRLDRHRPADPAARPSGRRPRRRSTRSCRSRSSGPRSTASASSRSSAAGGARRSPSCSRPIRSAPPRAPCCAGPSGSPGR